LTEGTSESPCSQKISERIKDIAGRRRRMRSKSQEFILPEWFFQFVRPPLNFVWRGLFKIRYSGIENIPQTGGLIIASNHQTYIDPFWLSIPIKRPLRFLAWDAAFDWPLVGKLIQLFGAWPLQIERSDPAAIRRTLQWLREGEAVVIFPEGARGRADGSMLRFKGGAVRLALEAEVPILPVTIRGAHRVWPAGQPIPRLGTVVVTYHPLLHVKLKPGEETRACARRESDRLASVIQSAL
jgi:1-acyl-sn-glycerol-3-phosphate acyltransferase